MAIAKKMSKTGLSKSNVKLGDLKPSKDAKGGVASKRSASNRGSRSLDGRVGRQLN
jgi:hypothetical protein